MKCRLRMDMGCLKCEAFPGGVKPSGTLIEHPDAWKLVQMGVADPADEECRQAAGLTPDQIKDRHYAYLRMERARPEDWEAYDAGLMVGYNPEGDWRPGPNYFDGCEEQYRSSHPDTEETDDE